MNPVFEILPEAIDTTHTDLICEIGEQGISYLFQNANSKIIEGLSVFQFDKKNSTDDIPDLLKNIFNEQALLKKNYNKVFISYSFDESVLVPEQFYKPELNNDVINLMFGDLQQGITLTDLISKKNIYNIYKVPADVHHTITTHFPLAAFSHQYSILLKHLPAEGNIMQVVFYKSKIVIALVKEGALQIIQTYNYKAPEDISYHMLNACQQFEVNNATIQLSGMIEKDSILSREIHKYFTPIIFVENEEYNCVHAIKNLPSQYFSHLFSISSCV